MPALTSLTADHLCDAVRGFRDALRAHQDGINRLNVYPVPDGDTGTNMALTLESVVAELDGAVGGAGRADLAVVCKAISHGSLMGARGNSGVILSQILRGVCDSVKDGSANAGPDGQIDGGDVARALEAASDAAYGAVMRPVEGTILTVVRECAAGARGRVDAGDDLVGVLDGARASGGDALASTPEMLPVLAEAGVVDAGGTGLLLLLDVLLHLADGRPVPEPDASTGALIDPAFLERMELAHAGDEHDVSGLRYEVMYFLEAPDETIPAFKDVWAGIGDSIVVVGGDGIWNCHIHTDDIGASVEAAIQIGRPTNIRVTDLLEQVEEERWVREAPPEPDLSTFGRAQEPVETAVVAVATGDGISRIFHSLGVQGMVAGGQSMNPSTAELLAAVEAAPSRNVVLLPNNKNIIPVAEQVDAETDKSVFVVPTRGVAEGFASLLAYDPGAQGAVNAASMTAAAERVVAGEVTRAVRDSRSDVGPISEGDFLGICRDGIKAVASSLDLACVQLLDTMLDDEHELVTIIEGEGSSDAVTRHIEVWLQEHHPEVGTEVHHGGQPLYPYLFGIE
jgi:DAK2 domain fusion protein YloV